jgi:hypothetical protein
MSTIIHVQLATRIPKELHHAVRIHCARTNVQVQHFVARALRRALARSPASFSTHAAKPAQPPPAKPAKAPPAQPRVCCDEYDEDE